MDIMKARPFNVFFVAFLIFTACQDDNDGEVLDSNWLNCLEQENMRMTPANEMCSFPGLTNAVICDTIFVQEVIPISDEVKSWMPYYCLEEGDRIRFWNGKDKVEYGIIESKDYFETRITGTKRDSCLSPDNLILYCYLIELAVVKIYLKPLRKIVDIYLWGPSNSPFNPSLNSSISINIDSGEENSYHGQVRLNPDGEVILGEVMSSFSFRGAQYGDVVELIDYSSVRSNVSFYYSKSHGIVRFNDNYGEEWVLVK